MKSQLQQTVLGVEICEPRLVLDATCEILFDDALGTAPGQQAWLFAASDSILTGGSFTQTLVPDGVQIGSDRPVSGGYSNYIPNIFNLENSVPKNVDFPQLDRFTGFELTLQLQVSSESHANNNRAGFSVILLAEDRQGIELGFWEDEIWAQGEDPLFTKAEGVFFDTTASEVHYAVQIQGSSYRLLADSTEILTGPLRDYTGFGGAPYTLGSYLYLGDNTSSAGAVVTLGEVTINADGLNADPTDISLSAATVAENLPVGTIVGELTTTDADSEDVHTYELVGGATTDFQLVGNQLQTAASFNFEVQSAFSLTIRTTDQGGGTYQEEFSIGVEDRNDAPQVNQGLEDQVAYPDLPFSMAVPADAFVDEDAGDSLTFAASTSGGGPLPGWLLFDETTKTFSGTPTAADLGTLALEVTATDAANAAATATFALEVAVPTPPQVTSVKFRGTDWDPSHPFFDGFELPDGSDQLLTLPWTTIDSVLVAFDQDVTVKHEDLQVIGVNVPQYHFLADAAGFSYQQDSFTATWTLASSLAADKLLFNLTDAVAGATSGLALDGEWTDMVSLFSEGSGDQVAGGEFSIRVDVLPGDVNATSDVRGNDVILVRNAQFSSPGDARYNPRYDIDGDGKIRGDDLILARNRQFTTLPADEPASMPSAPSLISSFSITEFVSPRDVVDQPPDSASDLVQEQLDSPKLRTRDDPVVQAHNNSPQTTDHGDLSEELQSFWSNEASSPQDENLQVELAALSEILTLWQGTAGSLPSEGSELDG